MLRPVLFNICSNVLEKWTDSAPSSLPLLQEFMANGLRVWVFR